MDALIKGLRELVLPDLKKAAAEARGQSMPMSPKFVTLHMTPDMADALVAYVEALEQNQGKVGPAAPENFIDQALDLWRGCARGR